MPIDRTLLEQYPPNIQAALQQPSRAACFLGFELLDVDSAKGFVRAAYQATGEMANRFGAIHGGMTAAMLDDVIALAAGLTIGWGQITPTLEMKVTYVAQGQPGMRLIGEAHAIRRGGSVSFLEADLKTEDGKLIATASATILIAAFKREARL